MSIAGCPPESGHSDKGLHQSADHAAHHGASSSGAPSSAARLAWLHSLKCVCAQRPQDAKKSLDFYTRVMGMTLLLKLDFPDSKFSLFFLGYHPEADIPEDPAERVRLQLLGQPLADLPISKLANLQQGRAMKLPESRSLWVDSHSGPVCRCAGRVDVSTIRHSRAHVQPRRRERRYEVPQWERGAEGV